MPRIEIHRHTEEDIRQHAWSLLRQNDRFNYQSEKEVKASLEKLLDYIGRNAKGVFLWANSIASLANDELNKYESAEDLHLKMEKLPNTMVDLYHRLLEQVDPTLRLKAYIALEIVLRLGKPTLETVFHSVQETEIWLEETTGTRPITRKPFSSNVSQEDLQLFRGQLVVSCRGMLQFSEDEASGYESDSVYEESDHGSFIIQRSWVNRGRDHSRQNVSLVHASAKEFLTHLDFHGILFPQDSLRKPIGNGHGYYLLYARSWLNSMARQEINRDLDCMEIVLDQALELNATMTAEDANVFFRILDGVDDTASPDEDNLVLAEKVFCASGQFPHTSWLWLLEAGAKITRFMVGAKGSFRPWIMNHGTPTWTVKEAQESGENDVQLNQRAGICDDIGPNRRRHDAWDILRLPEFRRREWYTEEAAEAAEEMEPGWFVAEDDPAGDSLVVTD
ncbi:hypothetical protein F5X68DRAFT_226539 [Plectosphaerella plurivora]|uniref:Uncharacterized protein n=1 Tax=Plectosphaerella plurivora TaxID=936078 RepID=A0A9P8VMG2_9PEZI|nr:hypothetical protein F5X68DRAFT_226539 [Plectosphaerella plurivora]